MKDVLNQLIQCDRKQIHREAEAELHRSSNDESAALLASMPRSMSDGNQQPPIKDALTKLIECD